MRSGMPSRSCTRARAGADGVLAVRSDGDVQVTTLAEASTTMMVFRIRTSLWGEEKVIEVVEDVEDVEVVQVKPPITSPGSPRRPRHPRPPRLLLRRRDGAELLLDLLERAEDERAVVRAAAPENSHELDVVAAR